MAQKKYKVLIGHLVGFQLGDTATKKELEEHGGTVEHLVKLGAIGVVQTEDTQTESEAT